MRPLNRVNLLKNIYYISNNDFDFTFDLIQRVLDYYEENAGNAIAHNLIHRVLFPSDIMDRSQTDLLYHYAITLDDDEIDHLFGIEDWNAESTEIAELIISEDERNN